MSDSLRILFVSAEVAPFAKVGGLGDVAGSLPKALHELGHDVRVVMPAYSMIENGYPGVQPTGRVLWVPVRGRRLPAGVFEGRLPGSDVPVYFIAEHNLFNRGSVYGYDDDAYRFAFFSRAIFELIYSLGWRPDLLHAHDWHTAPAVFWLKTAGQSDPNLRDIATTFTIHNLAHQGRVSWDICDYLGIWTHPLYEESFGMINLLARAIYHSNAVTTVSPTYAWEITTPLGGLGLDGLLRERLYSLHGIVNGIDYDVWNPTTDGRIPHNFDAESLDERIHVRRALQQAVGLPQQDNVPLIAMISRLDAQKGVDLMGEIVYRLMSNWAGEAQFIVLGTGWPQYEMMFRTQESHFPHKMSAITQFRSELAPLIYGGSDIFLMPSLFEPCGLSQLFSMRYGCVPVVRSTGGLVDTVIDGLTGFRFDKYTVDAFWEAIARAIYVYNVDRPRWRQIQQKGMQQDFSWISSANKYVELYRSLLGRY